jgi:uncharacterized membrane protein
MKLFNHPIHMMLIHFPAALFPTELIFYAIYFQTANVSFGYASFYSVCGGVLFGGLAMITGTIDFLTLHDESKTKAIILLHGGINSVVLFGYCIIAGLLYARYPDLPVATVGLLVWKGVLNLLLIIGNFYGGKLVLKYKIGVLTG